MIDLAVESWKESSHGPYWDRDEMVPFDKIY